MTEDALYPRIKACFEGDIPRECATCPAYGDRCCFGREYDDSDSDCLKCLHRLDCRSATFSKAASATSTRTYRRASAPSRSSNVVIRGQPSRNISSSSMATTSLYPTNGRTPLNGEWGEVFAQVGRDSMWNAITGVFETLLHFLKNHRWVK